MNGVEHPSMSTDASVLRPPVVMLLVGASLPGMLVPRDWTVQYVIRPELAPIPNVRPWLRGAYVDRGQIVPVFDLLRWLDPERVEPARALAVLSRGDHRLGLLVAEEPRIATSVEPRPLNSAGIVIPPALAAHIDLCSHTEHGAAVRFDPWSWAQAQAALVVTHS